MGFKIIYWTPMSSSYFLQCSNLEKCGIFLKNGCFSRRLWPDWENTTWADMAGLGSIGIRYTTSHVTSQLGGNQCRTCNDDG